MKNKQKWVQRVSDVSEVVGVKSDSIKHLFLLNSISWESTDSTPMIPISEDKTSLGTRDKS